jgi:hypothetical protein
MKMSPQMQRAMNSFRLAIMMPFIPFATFSNFFVQAHHLSHIPALVCRRRKHLQILPTLPSGFGPSPYRLLSVSSDKFSYGWMCLSLNVDCFRSLCHLLTILCKKYPIAMHFAKHSAANALIDCWKSVELCQAYVLMNICAVPARRWEEDRSWLYTGFAIRSVFLSSVRRSPFINDLSPSFARIATDLNLHHVDPRCLKPRNKTVKS